MAIQRAAGQIAELRSQTHAEPLQTEVCLGSDQESESIQKQYMAMSQLVYGFLFPQNMVYNTIGFDPSPYFYGGLIIKRMGTRQNL